MFKIKKIDLLEWESLRKTSCIPSTFLSSEFIKSVVSSFRIEFIGLLAENDRHHFLLPCYIKGDLSEFQVGFIGYGGPLPIFNTEETYDDIDEFVDLSEKYLDKRLSKLITYPSENITYSGKLLSEVTYTDIIEIKESDYLFNHVFSGNVRTSIRKAKKNGVHIKKLPSEDYVYAHQILVDTQKRVGASYCTDFNFFSLICDSKKCLALGAYIENKLIGISIFLIDGFETFYYLNGTDKEFRNFSQNYLMLWEAIKYSVMNNIKFLNLGASHYPELKKFKQKWGATEYKVLTLYKKMVVSED